jgi:hypothetical protein
MRCRSTFLPALGFLAAFSVGSFSPSPASQRSQHPSATPRATTPVEFQLSAYAGPLRTLNATIGGKTAALLFDSGGGVTVLTPASLQQLGHTPFGRGTGFRHDGTRLDGRRGGPVDLPFGPFVYRGEVGVLALDELLRGLPPVAGIASLQTFDGQILTLDLGGNRIVVETEASLAESNRDAKELQVRIARPAAGAAVDLFVAIEGAHGPLWFELDCGNTGPVLVAPHAWEDAGLPGAPDATPKNHTVRIRGLGAVATTVATREMIYDGLLNAAFCERHVLTIDLIRSRAFAKAR